MYTLHRPLVVGPRTITELDLTAPTAEQLADLSAHLPDDQFAAALAALSLVTGVPAIHLEQLSARDFWLLSQIVANSFTEATLA